MVMRCCRAFPLVGIVEFIMYGCMKYFRERYMASININNPQIQFCRRVTEYMKEKIAKAKQHRVISIGTMEHRFEVVTSQKSAKLNRTVIIFKTKCSIVELKVRPKSRNLSLFQSTDLQHLDPFSLWPRQRTRATAERGRPAP